MKTALFRVAAAWLFIVAVVVLLRGDEALYKAIGVTALILFCGACLAACVVAPWIVDDAQSIDAESNPSIEPKNEN